MRDSLRDLLWSTLVPHLVPEKDNVFSPTPSGNHPTFMKELTMGGSVPSTDPSTLTGPEKITTGSGVLVWYANRGPNTVVTYGIVPLLTLSPQITDGSTAKGRGIELLGFNYPLAAQVYGGILWQETALPFMVQLDTSNQQATQFSMARIIRGEISVIMDSTAIDNNLPLGGYLSAASVGDIRIVAQTYDSSTTSWRAFHNEVMAQVTVPKDRIKKMCCGRPGDGIVTIIGPDVHPDLLCAQPDYNAQYNGQTYVYAATLLCTTYTITVPQANAYNGMCMHAGWVSPWNSTLVQNHPFDVTNLLTETILYPPGITPLGNLKIQVDVVNQTGVFPGNTVETFVHFVHFFASIDTATGAIVYTSFDVRQTQLSYIVEPEQILSFSSSSSDYRTAPPSSASFPTSSTVTGAYVGTQVQVYKKYKDGTPLTLSLFGLATVTYTLTSQEMFGPGELGICRVLKWDDVPPGQNIRFSGIAQVQATPTRDIAPFVEYHSCDFTICDYQEIAFFYNHESSPWRRVWILEEYRKFVEHIPDPLPYYLNHLKDQASSRKRIRREMAHSATAGLVSRLPEPQRVTSNVTQNLKKHEEDIWNARWLNPTASNLPPRSQH